MHPPKPEKRSPPDGAGFGSGAAPGETRRHDMSSATQPSRRPKRCPWFADVIHRSAGRAWHATAFVHAGTGAWERANDSRSNCIRACTLLPPGTDPASIRWPSVRFWIGDTGDLPTADAIELARVLIDAGAELVQMVGRNLRPSLTVRSARRGA